MRSASEKREAMRALVLRAHAGQTRNGGRVPYAAHVLSVGSILDDALASSGELDDDPELALDIYLGGVGHDLYEDTSVSEAEIRQLFGERVNSLIGWMTNRDGDHDRDAYLAKMRSAADAVRLIKLADLLDNATSCAYGIHDLGVRWIVDFFVPIVSEMTGALGEKPFHELTRTARVLRAWLDASLLRLDANIAIAGVVGSSFAGDA